MSLVAQVKERAAKAIEDLYKVPVFADDVQVRLRESGAPEDRVWSGGGWLQKSACCDAFVPLRLAASAQYPRH